MSAAAPGEVTQQLARWNEGNAQALDALTPLVYDHLRGLAARFLYAADSGHDLQPTELVDELFIELLKSRRVEIHDRAHFFAFSARVMRHVLIRQAREIHAQKRGGGTKPLPLDAELAWTGTGDRAPQLDLDTAMDELGRLDEGLLRTVELRYIFGFTAEESARLRGTSKATVDRDLRFALAWLRDRLHPPPGS